MDMLPTSLSNCQSEKRELSLIDKRSIKSKDGPALIFLGPGYPEITELLEVGFNLNQIYGIDSTDENVIAAFLTFPELGEQLIHKEFSDFLPDFLSMEWSYVHLDYCGQPKPYRIAELVQAAKAIKPGGRLRATFMFESTIYNNELGYEYGYQLRKQIHAQLWKEFSCGLYRVYTSDKRQKMQMITMWFDKVG